ncbi:MAG: hypothetical protein Q9184_004757 [Pyrenodesmia sp. 2 TL-2023]
MTIIGVVDWATIPPCECFRNGILQPTCRCTQHTSGRRVWQRNVFGDYRWVPRNSPQAGPGQASASSGPLTAFLYRDTTIVMPQTTRKSSIQIARDSARDERERQAIIAQSTLNPKARSFVPKSKSEDVGNEVQSPSRGD